jgi:hypothetical protein
MVPQQVMTYRDVPRVQFRREAFVEQVPVSVPEQVTVDEGGYQMVWVSRPVTKTVARTVMQAQTRYRDVAFQTTERVVETHTQMIPRQTMRYIPETRQIGFRPIGPTMVSAPCQTCETTAMFAQPWLGLGVTGSYPTATFSDVTVAPPSATSLPQTATSGESSGLVPTPVDPGTGGAWQTIPQRQADGGTAVQQMGGALPAYSPPAVRHAFQGAPSAASAWQTRWLR